MSPNLTPRSASVVAGVLEGRSKRRFPIQLDLRYKVLRAGPPIRQGLGRTREFGSTELSFSADQDLPHGLDVELCLDWPLQLHGVCPLQLMIFGRVIHSSEKGSTLKIARYEFRTRRLSARGY